MRATDHAPRAQKKIRQPLSGGGNPVETSVRKIALPHIDPYGQGTLPSPAAGCRIRFPESLLMLLHLIIERRRFVKSRGDDSAPRRMHLRQAFRKEKGSHGGHGGRKRRWGQVKC